MHFFSQIPVLEIHTLTYFCCPHGKVIEGLTNAVTVLWEDMIHITIYLLLLSQSIGFMFIMVGVNEKLLFVHLAVLHTGSGRLQWKCVG